MESKRQHKINRLLLKELGEIFQRELQEIVAGKFITVTEVRITPDLGLAKIYLSMMLVEDKEAFLKHVNEHISQIRFKLGNRVKNQLRIIPELKFYLDESAEEAAKIDNLITGLDIPEESDLDEDDYKDLDIDQ